MSDFEKRYIIQDIETGEFLCSETLGGIGTTPYIKQAGQFDDYETAFEMAREEIDGAFSVFSFFVSVKSAD